MLEIERIVTIVKPKEKLLQWLQQLPQPLTGLTLENLRQDCTVLLIPAFEALEEARQYIDSFYDDIFINELSSWHDDKALWPENRSLALFNEWFDIEFHSMVYDLALLEGLELKDYGGQLQ